MRYLLLLISLPVYFGISAAALGTQYYPTPAMQWSNKFGEQLLQNLPVSNASLSEKSMRNIRQKIGKEFDKAIDVASVDRLVQKIGFPAARALIESGASIEPYLDESERKAHQLERKMKQVVAQTMNQILPASPNTSEIILEKLAQIEGKLKKLECPLALKHQNNYNGPFDVLPNERDYENRERARFQRKLMDLEEQRLALLKANKILLKKIGTDDVTLKLSERRQNHKGKGAETRKILGTLQIIVSAPFRFFDTKFTGIASIFSYFKILSIKNSALFATMYTVIFLLLIYIFTNLFRLQRRPSTLFSEPPPIPFLPQ